MITKPINRIRIINKKVAISALASLLVAVLLIATFAWYQSQVTLNGSTFSTGTIDFIATGYNEQGQLVTTILQEDKDDTGYEKVNSPLFNKTGWQAGHTDTAYIAVEKTGTLAMEYKITFSATGDLEYLGGFWYALTDITDDMPDVSNEEKLTGYISAGHSAQTESKGYSMATMDRYATRGIIENEGVNKRYYRLDYGMKESAVSEEYTGKTVEITPHIFVTQVGALDSDEGLGYTYNCSTWEDIEKARDSSLPGDSIKLMNNITYEGDLVFNKAINILTNNFVLEVQGNLIYDFVSSKAVTVNVTGNGAVKVTSPGDGIGGNFTVNAPGSDVSFIGSNNSAGDIVVAGKLTVNASRAYGAAGATFSRVKIIDPATYKPATVYVNSDTRVTVTDNTTITRVEAVAKSSNIEIQNAGTVNTVALSAMNVLSQITSPQIYIVNMGYIVESIELPAWSSKFRVISSDPLTCEGNTRIVQTITGNNMDVICSGEYTALDIEKESTDVLVAPIGSSDGELVVYYQDYEENGSTVNATIQSILEKYFREKGFEPSVPISEIRRLDIVSIGDKAVTNEDIDFFKSEKLLSLVHLDLERAVIRDTSSDTTNKLFDGAFKDFKRLSTLILPQNLEAIGTQALYDLDIKNIITIPGSVTEFGDEWFYGNAYVAFAASSPVQSAYTASNGMTGIKAIFVEEYYVDSYKAVYVDYFDRIFPMAQMDDSGLNFVRQIAGSNEWEIVYYIGSDATNISVGDGVRIDNNVINVTRVGEGAYRAALKDIQATVSFSNSIKSIGESAFAGTNTVKVSNWGSSLETIHSSAFEACDQLAGDILLSDSMQTIHSSAFYGCTKITGVNTGGTTLVENSAFSKCTSLVWVEMPNVKTLRQTDGSIGSGMFYGNTKLVSVKLPSLTNTEGIIFNNSTALVEVIFGDSMYTEAAVSGYTSFYTSGSSKFNNLRVYFDVTDTTDISVNNISDNKVYPVGEKWGTKEVNGFNVGEFIVSDTLNDDGSVTIITSNNNTFSGTVDFPAEWNVKPVTRIYDGAFRNQTFTDATLNFPDSLREIGSYAFYERSGIVSVANWGESLETIGRYAFASTGLSGALVLPADNLASIGNYAFYRCSGITSVDTGGATDIGVYAFNNCKGIVTANLPNVEYVGDGTTGANYLFGSCSNLVAVWLPKLTSVQGGYMFNSCTNLKEVYMESDEPSLGSSTFNSITNRKSIKLYVPTELVDTYKTAKVGNIPDQVYPNNGIKVGENYIGEYNIGNYIILPNDDGTTATLITTTLNYSGDVVLDDILGGYQVTKIGPYAFKNQTFTSVSLTVGKFVTEIDKYAFSEITAGLLSVDLSNTRTVGERAFYNCNKMTLLVANKLESTSGTYAFSGCSALTTLNLPKLHTADNYSFSSCKALVTVSVPELVTMGSYVFSSCTKLVSIYFEDIQTFGGNDFRGCTALAEFIINKVINEEAGVPSGNPYFNDSKSCIIMVPMMYISNYVDSSGNWHGRPVVSYDDVATDTLGNTYIVELNGTDCIIKNFIGNGALTTVVIPNTMQVDGSEYNVAGIDAGAFNSVASTLASITLPAGMHDFGSNSLSELTVLTQISVNSASRYFIADENGVLYSKDGRMLVKYPIGKTDAAYTVNDTVVAIGEYAFSGCYNLTEVTLGSSVAVIDSTSFAGCALQSVTFTGDTPPLLMGADIFDCEVEQFAMTVPEGAEKSYVRSMNFAKYAQFINSGTEIPTDGDMNVVSIGIGYGTVEYAALPPEPTDVEPVDEDESEPPPEPDVQ